MTEQELQDTLTTNGWEILQTKEVGSEAGYTNKGTAACKVINGAMKRQWFKYYLKSDGICYWQDVNPFPDPPAPNFSDEVRAKITDLKATAVIKAGYIERTDLNNKTCVVMVIKPDNTFAMYHVYKDTDETIRATELSGSYPN